MTVLLVCCPRSIFGLSWRPRCVGGRAVAARIIKQVRLVVATYVCRHVTADEFMRVCSTSGAQREIWVLIPDIRDLRLQGIRLPVRPTLQAASS